MNTRTITALCYNDRNEIDFATTDPQKTEFREMIRALSDQTGEDWGEYLQEVEVEEDTETGHITTEAGNIFEPTGDKASGNYRIIPTTTQNP
jgi:hypothetical protein